MRRLVTAAVLVIALWASAAGAADPLGPPVSTLALPAKAHGLHLVGTRAYVATEKGLAIVDLATPTAPVLLGQLPPSLASRSEAVVVSGQYAYLASPVSGLLVVDVLNPAAPKLLATRRVSYGLWDVAIKGHVLYGVSPSGEMYLFDIEGPVKAKAPVQIKVLGLPAWAIAGQDAMNLARLRSQVTAGNARATGVSVAGDYVFAVDWAYGRLYAWDASDPEHPVFAGTHYAPYLLKAVADIDNDVVYMLSAFGGTSGVYSVPISLLSPTVATRHATCAPCGFLKSLFAVDQGGLAAVPGFRHIVWAGGKGLAEVHVVNVETPAAMVDEANGRLGSHGIALAGTMGLAAMGDHVVVTAGLLGLRVYHVPGLTP